MKCEYCDQEMKQVENEEHDKIWICKCKLFEQEQKLHDKIFALERELRISKQELSDIHRQSLFTKEIIKLNKKYEKHIMC